MALASQVKETPSISPHLPCSQTDLPSVTDYPYSHCYPVSSSNSANIQLLSVSSSQLQNKALPYAQNYSKNILPYAYHLPPFSSSLSPNTSARITSNAKNACCFVPSFFPYAPSIPPFKESFNQSQIFLPSVSSSAFSDSFLHPTSPALPQLNRGHLHYFSSSSSCANFASEPLPLSSISASLTARPIPPPSTSVSAMPQKNDNIGLCNAMNTCAQPVLDCDGGNNSSDTNDKSFASCYLSLCGSSSPLNSISPSAAQFHTLNLPQKNYLQTKSFGANCGGTACDLRA